MLRIVQCTLLLIFFSNRSVFDACLKRTMTVKCIILIILFALLTLPVFSNMYKVTLRSIELCTKVDPPYIEQNPMELNVVGYNKSGTFYFRGNLTIRRNMQGFFYRIKTGVEKAGGEIKYTNQYKKLTCKSVIPKLLLISAGVRYNEKTCEIYKGNYSFNKIDVHKLQPGAYYFPLKEIGESLVYFSVYNNRGTCICTLARYVLKAN